MKNLILNPILFITLVIIAFSSCVPDDKYDNIDTTCTVATPTKTVSDIYATANSTPKLYADDDIIEAYVTSSDAGGTFYKSISFVSVDGTKAFSIPVDMYNIYTEFEPGRKVYVYLKDNYYNITYGSLIIGDLYEETSIGRLVPEDFRKVVKASCEKIDEEELVQRMTITEALNNNNINKLIEIDNVQFADEAMNTTYYNPKNEIGGATNINLIDENGKTIIFRTSQYAKFAGKLVASGSGKVRGVLTKYNSDFQFLARTESDIQLTNSRVEPLFEETFTSNFPLWTKYSVTGSQVWTLDTQYGNPGSCAKMSGFASGSNANEDWLISPSISLSGLTSSTLTFDTATKFSGNPLEILISSDYSGSGNPTSATWTPFTATLSPSTGSYIWTNSGKIDISTFAGKNIYIAFKYTSTSSASATWEVDNVKVIGN
ncbi:MAG TPA: DUF5689 domain-containing protein [Flavobacterium sp.]|nr:DUF5689 domain-containing protein [Flavobacterium sp.]